MMKFFRKYTKHLLAVFMALLLVVWLGGDALSSLWTPDRVSGKDVRATMFGSKVLMRDLWPAGHKAEILDTLFGSVRAYPWRMPWIHVLLDAGYGGSPQLIQSLVMQIPLNPLGLEEWYMLSEEATRGGIHIPQEEVDRFRENFAPELLDMVMKRHHVSAADIDRAIQAFLRVQRSALSAVSSIKVSEADLQDMIRQLEEKVRIKAVILDTKSFLDPTYEPIPADEAVHFEKYKNVASRPGDSLDFGYQLPETVQIQYIKVAVDPLIRRQKVSDEDAYEYWQSHKTEFQQPASQPASTRPASQRPASQPYETFTQARQEVLDKMQKDRARREAERIAREVIALAGQPWRDVPTSQPGGVKQVPAGEASPDAYTKLLAKAKERFGDVFSLDQTPLLDRRSLSTQPGVGRAVALKGSDQEMPAGQAAFMVPEVSPGAPPAENRFFRSVYQTAPEPFVDNDGNAFVIRTIAARPKHAPESLDVVRNRVREDIRRQRAFEEAGKQAKALAEAARKNGIDAALAADAALAKKLGAGAVRSPEPFSKMQMGGFGMPRLAPNSVPMLGQDPALIEGIFSMKSRATTQPTQIMAHEQRLQSRWVVVQYVETVPVTRDEYQQARGMNQMIVKVQRQLQLLGTWFSPENIRERVGWKDAAGQGDPQKSGMPLEPISDDGT